MVGLQVLAAMLYLGLGVFQFAATIAGLEEWVGLHLVIAVPVALFLAYCPLVGTIVGMFGAVTAWGWSWLQAGALFFGPFVLIVIIVIVSGGIEALTSRR